MGIALMFLLALYQLQSATHSEIIETPRYNLNSLSEEASEEMKPADGGGGAMELLDTLAADKTDQAELEFRYPISAIGIDYAKNSVVLRFQKYPSKQRFKYDPDWNEKRKSLQNNFMHFGKRQAEEMPKANSIDEEYYEEQPGQRSERSVMGGRDSRGDNFMRFGRAAKQDFMRFGRDPKQDFMRFGRDPKQDFMRFGRDPKQDFMRFGRDPKQDFMRFGRDPKQDFMRFGREPKQDFMRFGRDPKQDFMRFGRSSADSFMRFGKNPKQDFMRFGRDPKQDFMRFGRSAKQDFMRFGRSQQQQQPDQMEKNFIRFGRPENFMRFGRNPPEQSDKSANFMRFGKSDSNFMRFGKSVVDLSSATESNQTSSQQQKHDIREAAKLLKQSEAEAGTEESNPVDKAITMLFSKHQRQQQEQQAPEEPPKSGEQTELENGNNLDDDRSGEQFDGLP